MNERFRGGKRAAQNFGYFLVAQLILPAKQDGRALGFGQSGERLLDFFGKFTMQQVFRRQKNLLVLILPCRQVVAFRMRFLQRLGGMARAPADFVQAKVAGDGEQPGGKLGGALVTGADL